MIKTCNSHLHSNTWIPLHRPDFLNHFNAASSPLPLLDSSKDALQFLDLGRLYPKTLCVRLLSLQQAAPPPHLTSHGAPSWLLQSVSWPRPWSSAPSWRDTHPDCSSAPASYTVASTFQILSELGVLKWGQQ